MTSPSDVVLLVPVIAHAVAIFGDEQKATHCGLHLRLD